MVLMCVNFSQFLLKNDPVRPGPSGEKIKKKKPSFLWRLVEKIDFENFTQKIVDSCRKNIKKIGQFYVTLICSLNLRKNRMILVVKTSKNGPFLCHADLLLSPQNFKLLMVITQKRFVYVDSGCDCFK